MADRMMIPDRRPIIESTAGAHLILAGTAGYEIVLVGLALTAGGQVQITIQDDSTSLIDLHMAANGNIVLPEGNIGWARANAGESLHIFLGGNVAVGGVAICRKVPVGMEV